MYSPRVGTVFQYDVLYWKFHKKIYNPPYLSSQQLCFWLCGLIRAPLPNLIVRTIGTMCYNYRRHKVHFSNWEDASSSCCWSFAWWAHVSRHRGGRNMFPPSTWDRWYSNAKESPPWCCCGTKLQLPPWMRRSGLWRGRIGVARGLNSCLELGLGRVEVEVHQVVVQ